MNDEVETLRELVEHRQRKLDAAKLGKPNRHILKRRTSDLDEAKRKLAAAIAAKRKEEQCQSLPKN